MIDKKEQKAIKKLNGPHSSPASRPRMTPAFHSVSSHFPPTSRPYSPGFSPPSVPLHPIVFFIDFF